MGIHKISRCPYCNYQLDYSVNDFETVGSPTVTCPRCHQVSGTGKTNYSDLTKGRKILWTAETIFWFPFRVIVQSFMYVLFLSVAAAVIFDVDPLEHETALLIAGVLSMAWSFFLNVKYIRDKMKT